MTKALDGDLLTQAQSDNQAPILLVELDDWGGDSVSDVSWANTLKNVTFGGRTYQARDLAVKPISYDSGGRFQEVELSVDNSDLGVTTLINDSNPKGDRSTNTPAAVLTLRRVFLDDLTVSHVLAADLDVQSYRIPPGVVQFYCAGLAAQLRRKVPNRLYSRLCWKEFGSAECGVATSSAQSFCSVQNQDVGPHEYTIDACIAYDNQDNFGGFTLILPRRIR